ncbi:TPA: DUF551 domain-containing protein [Klebsiella pneumoniae]|nr:DUF551 domain-containing protein [Klebsiella pneumoniae]
MKTVGKTITRERLEQLADNNTICKVSWDERIELAQIALAALDSEPVAWRRFQETPTDGGYWILYDYRPNCSGVEPLYRHAQQPVVPDGYVMVPKEPTDEMLAAAKEWTGLTSTAEVVYIKMLAAAPQSPGSEPATVPGKWIPVSERMPEVGDIVLTAMGGVVNVGEMECSAGNCRFFTSVISGRELPATHWMPLPAAPQEAINALIPLASRNEQEGK